LTVTVSLDLKLHFSPTVVILNIPPDYKHRSLWITPVSTAFVYDSINSWCA